MDDGVQTALDLDCNRVPPERPAIVEHGEKAASHFEKRYPFDFGSLFFNGVGAEEMHNRNSMAVLGDSISVLRGMRSQSVLPSDVWCQTGGIAMLEREVDYRLAGSLH